MKRLKKINGYCATIAIKYVSGLSDSEVLEVCVKNGFKQQWGMEDYEWQKAAKLLGLRIRRLNLKKRGIFRVKLSRIIQEYPDGVYFVGTNNHLFVMENGKIIDPINECAPGLDRMITGVWKVLHT